MPDLIVSPTVQSLVVTPTTQALTLDATPPLTVNSNLPLVWNSATLTTNNLGVSGTQWTNIVGLALTAGTWMVWGEVELYHSGAFLGAARISDLLGNTTYAAAEGTVRASGFSLHLSISGVVVLAASDTIYLAAKGDTTIFAKSFTNANSAGNCTNIKAIRLEQ